MSDSCSFTQAPGIGFTKGVRTPDINQAVLQLSDADDWDWYGWTSECHGCNLQYIPAEDESRCAIISSTFPYHLEARRISDGITVKKTFGVGHRAAYSASIDSQTLTIKMDILKEAVPNSEIWGPLVTLLAVILVLVGLKVASQTQRSNVPTAQGIQESLVPNKSEEKEESTEKPIEPKTSGGGSRLNSLDTFRGISLTLMIFVNYGGGGYWWLDHSSWDGLTVADLLFPWFMWIMGVSMALALKSRRTAKQSRITMLKQIGTRALKLIAVGLFLDCPRTLSTWRFPGVLQYFAFSYTWCALSVVMTGSWDGRPGQLAQEALDEQSTDVFLDLRYFWREWPLILCAPLMWLVLTFGVPVPGCPTGYLGPGGLTREDGDCTGGSHRYIDIMVFGKDHIYGEPTCLEAYDCQTPYDPEGLVGAFNAVLLTYLGLLVGRVLVYHRTPKARVGRLGLHGAVCLVVAACLCGFKQYGGLIPVNKNLWSTSFVLVTAGGACWLLAAFYLIVDEYKLWGGAPFRYTGMNSIVVYAGSEVFQPFFPFSFATTVNSHWGHLATNVIGAACWNVISTKMYNNRVFVKL